MEKIAEFINKNQASYIEKLKQVVAIASVSGEVEHRKDVFRMGEWLETEMKRLNISDIKKHMPGEQVLEGQKLQLPPILLGRYGKDPNKKTVLVYGHYDVQPALLSDGWETDPWTLVEKDGKLYGRGSTDDKAPVISWLHVIEAYQKLSMDFPVNLLMCFEGMEESGSEGLDELIVKEAKNYFKSVDCVCISDNYWLGTKKPCVTYGLRGISYFNLKITGPGKDLHSGVFGGTVHEPMTDLVILLSKLVSPSGKILIPGIYDKVAPVTKKEDEIYATLDFSINDIHEAIGSKNTISEDKKTALMNRWRNPSLSIHGVEGAFSAPGAKTVIPAKVIGKFSIRTVPDMEPKEITALVKKFIQEEFKKLGSKNVISVECGHEGKPWVADTNHWNFTAASKAVERVYGVKPDFTREGGSIPVTLTFSSELQKNVLLLPMGRADDGAHSINEKIDRSNYIGGIKLLAYYLDEISKV